MVIKQSMTKYERSHTPPRRGRDLADEADKTQRRITEMASWKNLINQFNLLTRRSTWQSDLESTWCSW
jgi:hypothetical protein